MTKELCEKNSCICINCTYRNSDNEICKHRDFMYCQICNGDKPKFECQNVKFKKYGRLILKRIIKKDGESIEYKT